jgi:hypothetical protein
LMRHGLGIGWGVYAAICVAAPLLWGLAVYLILRHLPERRRNDPRFPPRDEVRTSTEDFRI